MYQIDSRTGSIHFPDGFILAPPYENARYHEYAEWVNQGNQPEEIGGNSLIAVEDIEVNPYQAREAMDRLGVLDTVLAVVAHVDTPRSIKTKFEYTLSFRRNDDAVILMASHPALNWTAPFLDELFALAKTIK